MTSYVHRMLGSQDPKVVSSINVRKYHKNLQAKRKSSSQV